MEALGIDIKLLVVQIINFGILFFVLKKFLYTPILKLLDERKKEVEKQKELLTKTEEEFRKGEETREKMIRQSRAEVEKERRDLINMANEEKKKILSEARKVAEKEVEKKLMRIKSLEEESLENIKKSFLNEAVNVMIKKLEGDPKRKGKLLERILD